MLIKAQKLKEQTSEVFKFPLANMDAFGEEPSSEPSATGDGGWGGET